jgi:hypothetical protein
VVVRFELYKGASLSMADLASRARRGLRPALVVAVASAALGVVPLVSSVAAPETVIRAVRVDVSSLLPRAQGPGIGLTRSGSLRAVMAARTATVTRCAPIWFDGVAVTWDGQGHAAPSMAVSTSSDGTSFVDLGRVDEEGGPDPGTPEYVSGRQSSSYVWTGGSRCVRVAMHLPRHVAVSNVRILFINSSGTSGGPGTGPRELGPVAVGPPGGPLAPTAAEAMTTRPRIITRAQWGADPRLMNCTPLVADVLKMGFVHHTAGSNYYSRSQADDVVRGIYAYDTIGRGWCDIGYNFLVDRYGDVFEGRSGGMTNDVVGAAQMGFNTDAFSVSMMGTFSSVRPPAVAVRALERVLAWRLDVGHVDPAAWTVMTSAGGETTRYPAGTEVNLRTISGHRDTGITACPGTVLYGMLPGIRSRVDRMGLPKMYHPRLSRTGIVSGQPANVRIRARGSATLRWTVVVLDPAGTAVGAFPLQRGELLDLLWQAHGPPAQPDVPGTYHVVISAKGRSGKVARPAWLAFTVKPAPSPSPSPTPSPTPSGSPSVSPSP